MTNEFSYDQVPYPSDPFAQTHPNHLAATATLFGLNPPSLERCRVLEVGCAGGGNLLPMAVTLPQSSFVGIDLSTKQINDGRRRLEKLALKNVELRAMDLQEIGDDFGTFDFIITHGVYSWISPTAQEKLLDVYRQRLSPNGVGYVSYNTYPGWHVRGQIRDMMCYHAKSFATPKEKVQQARALIDFLYRSCQHQDTHYSSTLKKELDLLNGQTDWYIYHEHLEDFNEPLYFHQFAERAAQHDLAYLGDTDIRTMTPNNFPDEVGQVLYKTSPTQIHAEQYLDFLHNRTFRQTLLCHREQSPDWNLEQSRLFTLRAAASFRPLSGVVDLTSSLAETFGNPAGAQTTVTEPVVKAALAHLSEAWPVPIPFRDLVTAARERLQSVGSAFWSDSDEKDVAEIGAAILTLYVRLGNSGVELHVRPAAFTLEMSERPVASPLARAQATMGSKVTNLRHETVTLGEFERQLLIHLDGERDQQRLHDRLYDFVQRGVLTVQIDGQPVHGGPKVRELVTRVLEEQLPLFARSALLIG